MFKKTLSKSAGMKSCTPNKSVSPSWGSSANLKSFTGPGSFGSSAGGGSRVTKGTVLSRLDDVCIIRSDDVMDWGDVRQGA